MKIYELRLTIGDTKLLYTQTFTTEAAAQKRFQRLLNANKREIRTAKLLTLEPDEEGSFEVMDVVSL